MWYVCTKDNAYIVGYIVTDEKLGQLHTVSFLSQKVFISTAQTGKKIQVVQQVTACPGDPVQFP